MATVTYYTTARYPDWIFEKTVQGSREEWFGTKEGVGYAVSGTKGKEGEIWGELLTRQKANGSLSWEPIRRNSFEGNMAECIKEAERRAEYWQSKGETDVYGEYLKLKMPA
jgi:hypothetical protein